MSTTLQELLNANNPIAGNTGAELNALASNGVVVSATVWSNVQGDGAGLGYPDVKGVLVLDSAAFGANAAVYVWFLSEDDGSNYESSGVSSGTTTTPPLSRPADLIIAVDNVTAAQRKVGWGQTPVCAHNKCLFWNQTGVALASSNNNVLNLYFKTDAMN